MSVKSLHVGLDDVDRVVAQDGSSTSDATCEEGGDIGVHVLAQFPLCVVIYEESDALVGPLSKDRGSESLVDAAEPFLFDDLADAMEEASVLVLAADAVVDELGLDRLHRGDHESRLGAAGQETGYRRGQPALLLESSWLTLKNVSS